MYAKIGNSKFVEMHGTLPDIYPSALVFYTRHRVNNTIFRTVYLQTLMHMWRNSVLGQMERLSIKCFFLTSCFSSYCESMHITLHVHH